MKTLYANGDSWTYGDEIPNTSLAGCYTSKYYGTWPWYLSRELSIPLCINDAVGAGSNDRIYRRTCTYIINYISAGYDPKELMIVLGWTTPERTELGIAGAHVRITTSSIISHWSVTDDEKDELSSFSKLYYTLIDPSLTEIHAVRLMISMRLLCKGHGITYHDFVAIGAPPSALDIIAKEKFNTVLDNMYPESWHEQCDRCADSRYPHSHPTSSSHLKWARLLAAAVNNT